MPDNFFNLFPDPAPVVNTVKHVAHHVHHAKPVVQAVAPVIKGFSMLTLLITNAITAGFAVGTSWYISHRGLQGVKNDVANAKVEVEKIKAHVFPATPAAPAA